MGGDSCLDGVDEALAAVIGVAGAFSAGVGAELAVSTEELEFFSPFSTGSSRFSASSVTKSLNDHAQECSAVKIYKSKRFQCRREHFSVPATFSKSLAGSTLESCPLTISKEVPK